MATYDFTTGPTTLPDVGELSYNTCIFGPLFESEVSCAYVQDEAKRTTKLIEYTITVEGYVTLEAGAVNVEGTFRTLEQLLSQAAGPLLYSGRGIKIAINTVGGDTDVAWGPIPEILEITPMGGGGSAKIKWTIKARIPPRVTSARVRSRPVLQFNYETTVSYDEAGYSQFRLSGTTEIPLTRTSVPNRGISSTVDDFRSRFPGELLETIDLTRFRVVTREFNVSRDKRTMQFNVVAEELPWMEMPPDVTIARGQFTFKPSRTGPGLSNWLCTLTVTYTIPKGRPRRVAWWAFLMLLRIRMQQGPIHGSVPAPNGNQNPAPVLNVVIQPPPPASNDPLVTRWRRMLSQQLGNNNRPLRNVILIDFSGTEGLYLDSRTVTFSATWRLTTTFNEILLASGLWKKVDEHTENEWATSVRNISGYTSWLQDRLRPSDDVIVDFGY